MQQIFKLLKAEVLICEFEYLHVDENWAGHVLTMADIFHKNPSIDELESSEELILQGFLTNDEGQTFVFIEHNLTLMQTLFLEKCNNTISVVCEITNLHDPMYEPIDQEQINLYYYWHRNPEYVALQKKLPTYLLACMKLTGITTTAPQNKEVYLNGKQIDTWHEMFNIIGEALRGNGGYMGHNLYSIEDCFKECKMDKDCNNKVTIEHFSLLTDKVDHDDYEMMDGLVEIFTKYGVEVNIS